MQPKLESIMAKFQGVGSAFYGQVIWLTCMRSSYGDPLIWATWIRCRNLFATSRGRLRLTKPTICLWRILGTLEIRYWRKLSTYQNPETFFGCKYLLFLLLTCTSQSRATFRPRRPNMDSRCWTRKSAKGESINKWNKDHPGDCQLRP